MDLGLTPCIDNDKGDNDDVEQMIQVLYLVAFYGFRCVQNLNMLCTICRALRDRIDKYILKRVTSVHCIRSESAKINYTRYGTYDFPHYNVLDSMKDDEYFHFGTDTYDKEEPGLYIDMREKRMHWDISIIESKADICQGDLISHFFILPGGELQQSTSESTSDKYLITCNFEYVDEDRHKVREIRMNIRKTKKQKVD